MSAPSAATRAHAVGETFGPQGQPPAIPLVQHSRIKRLWHRICSLTKTTMLWLSAIGTVLMLGYQILYAWQQLPLRFTPDPGAQAWLVGLVALVVYVASKVPHLFGQEPGDAYGLVRELLLNDLNILAAVVFLTASFLGAPHAPNAVGITVMLLIIFIGMTVAQAIQAIVLSRRTWTDSTGAGSDM